MCWVHHVRGALLAAIASIVTGPAVMAGDDPPDKPSKGFALEEALKRTVAPPRNGVVLETPKAEVADMDGKKVLLVGWAIKYSGSRWPLVILEPSLIRPNSGRTRLVVVAKGKSGEAYVTTLSSPPWSPFVLNPLAEKEWFVTIPKDKGKTEGAIETDLGELKERFLKYYPDEFDSKVAPELYVRLEHEVEDRGIRADLDAWTGHLMSTTVKVPNPKW